MKKKPKWLDWSCFYLVFSLSFAILKADSLKMRKWNKGIAAATTTITIKNLLSYRRIDKNTADSSSFRDVIVVVFCATVNQVWIVQGILSVSLVTLATYFSIYSQMQDNRRRSPLIW
jgi:hypothetical protein